MYYLQLLSLVLFVIASTQNKFDHVIYIDKSRGSNSEECLLSNNESAVCKDLNWVLDRPLRHNSTQFVLAEGTHDLNTSIPTFHNLNQLQFWGSNSSSTALACTNSNVGFSFVNVENISFYNLKITNCSALRNSTSRKDSQNSSKMNFQSFYVSLFMLMCKNVVMENVSVSDSQNGIAVVMYNVAGKNSIRDSLFSGNNYAHHLGGGGFVVEFTYCIPGDDSCTDDGIDRSIEYFNSESYYNFEKVEFCNNSALNGEPEMLQNDYFIPYKAMHRAFGQGGGLYVVFKGTSAHNVVSIRNCKFAHNAARHGSGLFVSFQDYSSNNTVAVEESLFLGNGFPDPLTSQGTGGGIKASHYIATDEGDSGMSIFRNCLLIQNCNFTENAAFYGGGVSIFPSRIKTSSKDKLFLVTFTNSSFTRNTAQLGAAIEATLFSLFVSGLALTIQIESSNFTENTVDFSSGPAIHELGVGSVYTNGIPIHFVGAILFRGNVGSALSLVGTKVDFSDSRTSFEGNSGSYGGAINLMGSAFLLVNSNTMLLFINNHAKMYGGAIRNIYTEMDNFESNPNCFVRHRNPFMSPEDWNANFTFIDNSADVLGFSIYTTSLLECAWFTDGGSPNISRVFHWKNWSYSRNGGQWQTGGEIATSIGHIRYSNSALIGGEVSIDSFPGEKLLFPLVFEDDTSQVVPADSVTFSAFFLVNGTYSSETPKHSIATGKRGVNVMGEENSTINVVLNTLGRRPWKTEVNVQMKECPPGYRLNENGSCVCTKEGLIFSCLPKNRAGIRKGYWFGRNEYGRLELSLCPSVYCSHPYGENIYYSLPQTYSNLSDAVCRSHRKGIICGYCKENYGISVTDLKCVPCNDSQIVLNIIRYVCSEYIPLLIMFIVLLVFQVRLSSGPANSFIFFAQTVSSTLGLTADGHIYIDKYLSGHLKLVKMHALVYGIFNFRGVTQESCIHTKLNALDVFQLSYLVALFPLLFIVIVILAVKVEDNLKISSLCKKIRITKFLSKYTRNINIRNSLLHVFSAYILLSYTKLTLSSLYILKRTSGLSGHYYDKPRSLYAGQYEITNPKYSIRYMTPALIVLGITNLLPIFLFKYPIIWLEMMVRRFKWLSRIYSTDKVHIFLDTFQGCYKDNRRYYAGILFLFRMLMGAAFYFAKEWYHQFIFQFAVSGILLAVAATLQPYREGYKYLNTVDLLIFTILVVVNGLSLSLLSFNYVFTSNVSNFQRIYYTQQVLVYLPMVYMLAFVAWKITPKACQERLKSASTKISKLWWFMRRMKLMALIKNREEVRRKDGSHVPSEESNLLQEEQWRVGSASFGESPKSDYLKDILDESNVRD